MTSPLIKQILFDFFDGKHTSIQRKLIEEWLRNEENREVYYKFLDEWETQHPQYIVDSEHGLRTIYRNINTQISSDDNLSTEVKTLNSWRLLNWLVAASVVIIALYSGWNYLKTPSSISYKQLVENTKSQTGEVYEKKNLSNKPLLINLPDHSSVLLQPQSKICYSRKQYNHEKREVILSGEAFFEVQKNAQTPFFVYANNLITKVLGTSFSVSAKPLSTEMEVVVKTGKVAVFMQNDSRKNEKINGKSLEGIVLVANEKVKINGSEAIINRPVLVNPEKLPLPIQKYSFDFDDTPAIDVLETLQRAYNIQIVYNKEKLSGCRLTAHLSDEPLSEKIKLICIALDADYEESDTKISIKSNGCR